jgi:hypothetical protein
MPVSQCTRCDQLIEYDASHEGDEVLCPACDNITRLKPLPEKEPTMPRQTAVHRSVWWRMSCHHRPPTPWPPPVLLSWLTIRGDPI